MSLLAGLSQQGDSISAHNADPVAHIVSRNLTADLSQAGYVGTDGNFSASDQHWIRSQDITVSPGDSITFSAKGHPIVNFVSFYTLGGVYISGIAGPAEELSITTATVQAPSGAAFARVSCASPTWEPTNGFISTFVLDRSPWSVLIAQANAAEYTNRLKFAPTASRRLKLQATDKVLLYGDSIFSTDYPWLKTAMESLTGAICYNGGFSGVTTAGLAADSRLQRIWDYEARLCIVMVGGNDTGAAGTVGTFDGSVAGESVVAETSIAADYAGTKFIQAVSHIIRKFKAQYGNIRTRAALTGAETEAEKTAKIEAVLKPVLVFCTSLPQKRNNAEDAFSLPANWQRKRDAVVECCNKYGVHCVDLFTKAPFDMAIEPYWVGPTDKATNNGVLTMDGLHPNKWGYQIVAEIICAETGI